MVGRLVGLLDLGSQGTSSVKTATEGFLLLHHLMQPFVVAATLAAAAFERIAAADIAFAGK